MLGVCIGCTSVFAGYAIDGDLSDWGVNPAIKDWIPDGDSIDYKETDGTGEYHPDLVHGYNASTYDFQAMYFDDDSTYFYVAIATRYDPIDGYENDPTKHIGDLWIDLTDDMIVKKHNSNRGLILAVCDSTLIGKKLSDEDKELDLGSEFYNGDEMDKDEIIDLMKKSYIINIVGKESLKIADSIVIVNDNNVIYFDDIPHEQDLCMRYIIKINNIIIINYSYTICDF